ncbi:MAG: hypothetical protein PHQ03_05510 [Methylococcales bacterium]|nr:hypothetical protein [Methylococcales bacterium]
MEFAEKIKRLEEFKFLVKNFFSSYDDRLRTKINQNKIWVREEVICAGCFKTFTIAPPPAIGGLVIRDIDAFDVMFDPPYGHSVVNIILDSIDETIGVLTHKQNTMEITDTTASFIVSEKNYEKGYAFIVMAINPDKHDLVDVLDAIKAVTKQCGIRAERVDEAQTNERITDRILESIKKAEFVIVDLTYSRPNVFYEAGYAQGLNKTPIYIARDGTHLEFDIKDYPVIFFNNMPQLRNDLEARLKAIREKHI